ncbi:MAG: hypothetical protein IKY09_02695 [Methanocorpusculum sp.]|nr:hypothetical protein [Methanocorpusculum sp.]MBR5450586.1 hypothetical protein [Methanocorpusculum sp.]
MATFRDLRTTEKDVHHKAIFDIIAKHESACTETQDGYEQIVLDASELETIRDEMVSIVQDARPGTQTAEEMRKGLICKFPTNIKARMEKILAEEKLRNTPGIVQDGYANPITGIGTSIDPGMNVDSFIPVSILPSEATAYYANGGVPARIINKKAGCLSLDGLHFECSDLKPEEITELEDYANECGFSDAYAQAITQALIFGGDACYPVLDGDNPITMQLTLEQIKMKMGDKKKFIRYWVNADRWNCVFVPDYNITAQDYLYARSLFIPLGGVRVNTQRMAMVRPQKLPFWGAIQQMGWSTSDFEGWIKDFESYQIMKMSLPIMAQQSSLMYHAMPADGLIIENGPEFAKQYFKENEEQMRKWSMLHPRAINSVGEIKILERTYSGYRDLLNESRLALCASSGVAESILFEEKATGLASDNREDVTLKQSEMIRLLFNTVTPSFKNCIELLVCSCFGANSEQAKHARKVQIKADNGFVLSELEKSQLGTAFTTMAGQFTAMGVPLSTALKVAQKFVPSAEIDEKTMNELTTGEADGIDEDMWETMNAGRDMDNGMNGFNPAENIPQGV